jgi:hypothetical protein
MIESDRSEDLAKLAPGERYRRRRRWTHAEAGLLLTGLRCELVWLAYALLGDEQSERLLVAWVYQHAAGLAAREGWRIERGKPRLRRLAELAVWGFLRGDVWHSDREFARMFGVHHKSWGETWAGRYRRLRCDLEAIEAELNEEVRRHSGRGAAG